MTFKIRDKKTDSIVSIVTGSIAIKLCLKNLLSKI